MPSELTLADRKKVEIGRAIAGHCRVLMLDESLSGLTHDEAEELISEILALNRAQRHHRHRGRARAVGAGGDGEAAGRAARRHRHRRRHAARGRARSGGDRGLSRHAGERVADERARRSADLSVAYGDLFAVRDVSFSLEEGEVFVLLGANGAGKTSILRCISGLVPARTGSIAPTAGRSAGSRRIRWRRPASRMCPKAGASFPISPSRRIWPSASSGRAPMTVGHALAAVYELFPRLAERRRQLGGTLVRRRAADARDRPRDDEFPRLLMLDEPSLGLSPVLADLVFERLAAIRRAGHDDPAGRAERDLPGTGDAGVILQTAA